MGFDCIICGDREIWAFESREPRVCCDCYNKKHGIASNNDGWSAFGVITVNPALVGGPFGAITMNPALVGGSFGAITVNPALVGGPFGAITVNPALVGGSIPEEKHQNSHSTERKL
jgi:hypothetical protein